VIDSNTIQDLIAAAAPGSTVTLPPGSYPESGVTAKPASMVTVIGSPGAVLNGLVFDGAANLTLRGLECVAQPRIGYAIGVVNGSKNIVLDGLNVHQAAGALDGYGVLFRGASNVSLINSELHQLTAGVQHLDCDHVLITDNRIHDLTGDGIKGGGTSFITVSRNKISDLTTAPGDHPDAIQFWTINETVAASDITITDNDIRQGRGGPVQSIFLGDETGLGFDRVRITGNLCMGGMWNGIAAGDRGVTVDDNYVQGLTNNIDHGQNLSPWIIVRGSGVSLRNNFATGFLTDQAPGLAPSGNVTISNAAPGDYSAAEAWLKRRGVVVAADPRDAQISGLKSRLAQIAALAAAS